MKYILCYPEPPQNVTLRAIGSDTLEIRWEPPPQSIHHQFTTTLYIVYFENETYFVNTSSDLVMQLESLTPHTTYNCCVAANTTAGPSRLACASQTTLRTGMSIAGSYWQPGFLEVLALVATVKKAENLHRYCPVCEL